MSRWVSVLAGLVAAGLLAGCATVPTSGPVERHTPQATGVNSGVHVDPLPPADGASQLLVVEGFLHAMSVYQPDYTVARQYLTESASRDWHPESGVQVYADGSPPTEAGETVVLSAPLTGIVDSTGEYRPGPGTTQSHKFELIKNPEGQWRISNPPAGLLVSRYVFTTSFLPVNLYYLDASGSSLVPDPRYFAAGAQAPEAAVRAQLRGPSSWLAPAVRRLDTGEVTVEGLAVDAAGTADVILGGTADRLTLDQRRQLMAEFAYTLAQFTRRISSVRVTANGLLWRDDLGQALVRPDTYRQLSPQGSAARVLYLVREGKLQRLRDPGDWNEFTTVEVGLSRPEQVAVSGDLSALAAISQGGTRLEVSLASTAKPRLVRVGAGLLRPAFARNGELWSPAASGASALRVFKGEQELKVTVVGLPRRGLRALALSPDGSRVALILRQAGLDAVGIARVERAEGGLTLSGWRTVDLALNTGTSSESLDVGWFSDTELGVLRTRDQETGVVRVSQDGATATDVGPGESAGLTQLAVVPNRPAVARGVNGSIYRQDGDFNWNLAVTAVDAMTYSG